MRAFGKKRQERRKNIPPTFILKLLFVFVQTVAFQTSLRSYGSGRSSWCFLLFLFLLLSSTKHKKEDFECFKTTFNEVLRLLTVSLCFNLQKSVKINCNINIGFGLIIAAISIADDIKLNWRTFNDPVHGSR